jgi:hypothetical protein
MDIVDVLKNLQKINIDEQRPADANWIEIAIDEITSLRQQLTKPADEVLIEAAMAVVERWETPLWKDAPATAEYIYKLRDALNATQGSSNG